MRYLSIEGKIIIFKTLAISKLVNLALLTVSPNHIIEEIAKIQKSFVGDDSPLQLKHETLKMGFKTGGLKMLMYVLSLSIFSVLGLKNYMMNVFINRK